MNVISILALFDLLGTKNFSIYSILLGKEKKAITGWRGREGPGWKNRQGGERGGDISRNRSEYQRASRKNGSMQPQEVGDGGTL